MLRSLTSKSLRDARRGFLWWSLGLVGFVALIVPSTRPCNRIRA